MSEGFSSIALKIERRPPAEGEQAMFRIVTDRVNGKERTTEKTEWARRPITYARLALALNHVKGFMFAGMGRIPVGRPAE